MKNNVITVKDIKISIVNDNNEDYICISDIAKGKSDNSRAADVIRNWLRNRYTLEFLSTWEQLNNPNFKVFESEHFIEQVGLLTFTPSVTEWTERTNAIGLYVKRGKYGGTYAHKDIAFEFASAISPVFKLYLIKEFQRLKAEESKNKDWNAKRLLSKNNYLIHTDAIKNYILPNTDYYKDKSWLKYAEEADILNVILFKTTAKEWRKLNKELAKTSNMRDYATINELTVLSNLESHNAELIKEGKTKEERFNILSSIASYQLNVLNKASEIKKIES
ncbi:MAG TPA: KilA-N domain-containing protein [Candidatus Onthousia faecipullorum]|uniref:KilA-N domain-containing protein n=1 Tax=Candidatus Onthousia faecipullorum TaxID=2840887 RepID=A0A9D1GBY7_9FIRM|nr:KilA-N domain-containing protein [Candidatus Onthousia faecipullorum]